MHPCYRLVSSCMLPIAALMGILCLEKCLMDMCKYIVPIYQSYLMEGSHVLHCFTSKQHPHLLFNAMYNGLLNPDTTGLTARTSKVHPKQRHSLWGDIYWSLTSSGCFTAMQLQLECKKATHMQDRNTPAMICDTIQLLGLSVVVLFVYIAHLYWVKVHRFNVLLLLHGHYVTYGSFDDLQFRTWIYIAITCLKCFNSNSVAHLHTY